VSLKKEQLNMEKICSESHFLYFNKLATVSPSITRFSVEQSTSYLTPMGASITLSSDLPASGSISLSTAVPFVNNNHPVSGPPGKQDDTAYGHLLIISRKDHGYAIRSHCLFSRKLLQHKKTVIVPSHNFNTYFLIQLLRRNEHVTGAMLCRAWILYYVEESCNN
jgi:hypothetical protein